MLLHGDSDLPFLHVCGSVYLGLLIARIIAKGNGQEKTLKKPPERNRRKKPLERDRQKESASEAARKLRNYEHKPKVPTYRSPAFQNFRCAYGNSSEPLLITMY
jgi:hypothetical protein